jgi:hypothetical protein
MSWDKMKIRELKPMETDKRHAYQLLDRLGPSQFQAVVKLLEAIVHGQEDELTDEDRRVIAASQEYFRQNPEGGIPFEQVVADCGFTMDQIRGHDNR